MQDTLPGIKNILKEILDVFEYLPGQTRSRVNDIENEITEQIDNVQNLFMAKQLCEYVDTKCHPKAWGDRSIPGLEIVEWSEWLDKLQDKTIETHNKLAETFEK